MMAEEQETSYSGNESYKYVDPIIQSDRRVWIISPYIGKHYGEMIRRKGSRRDIRIITMDVPENRDGILAVVSRNARKGHTLFGVSLLMVLMLLISYFYGRGLLVLGFMVLFVIFIYYAIKAESSISPVRLRFARGSFVHEKIYIGEKIAVVGSANLTYNGMHKNIEHIEVIKEGDKIAELEKHFSQLWNASDKA